jgi:hypothetical protein
LLQRIPQALPLHVADPFAGTPHGVQDDPQLATLALSAQAPPQA